MELSPEKTGITHINDGFDFLGFNVRKYAGKLIIKPAKESVKTFLGETRRFIKSNTAAKTEQLIRQLNRKISGWTNYYRHVVAKGTFVHVDHQIFRALLTWINRRHPNKSNRWKRKRYFCCQGRRQGVFFASTHDIENNARVLAYFKPLTLALLDTLKFELTRLPTTPRFGITSNADSGPEGSIRSCGMERSQRVELTSR